MLEDEECLLERTLDGAKFRRRSSFRASVRRVLGERRGWDENKLNGHGQTNEVLRGTTNPRLPVVSLYTSEMRRVSRGVPQRPTMLSPGSRQKVDRLVKMLGPEVLTSRQVGDMVRKGKENFKRNYRQIHVSDNDPPSKKRRSLDVLREQNSNEEGDDACQEATRGKSPTTNAIQQQQQPANNDSGKVPSVDIHLTALFAAVEHGHLEKAKTILESTDVDINGVNSDGLSPLDVALLSSDRPLVKMLISFGAHEGNHFTSGESLLSHLKRLLLEAEERKSELAGQDSRNQTLWQRRSKGLTNLIIGYTHTRPPEQPSFVALDVTGSTTVNVRYRESDNADSPVTTKYKIEWREGNGNSREGGSRIVVDPRQVECTVDGLIPGKRYYFRVYCGNIKGWGPPSPPQSIVPSSWREVTRREDRVSGEGLAQLDKLFQQVRTNRPDLKALEDSSNLSSNANPKKKTTIKQLFTAVSKFHKHLRRGVYLSCLLYHEDKVLVTNEDFLPVMEVDETYPGSIYHDFHWLLKVACTWDDVKWLKQDMEKSLSSSAIHFRIKLLQAALQMQNALGVQDLGQLYHKPLRDSEGTIVICTVNYVKSPKSVSVLNSRWVPLSKLAKKAPNLLPQDAPLEDILMASMHDQITYHQVSGIKLSRGLYLCYLKMRSSVDLLQVLVPSKSPNILPHCKVRDNPHVNAEEWELLTKMCGSLEDISTLNDVQRNFLKQVSTTANRLLTYLQLSPQQAVNHRLYQGEIVEVSPDISLLVMVPPPEAACSAPGQGELLLQRTDLITLPLQVFEMVHLGCYQKQLVSLYSRLSCILELDIALAQHSHRQAFSSCEVSAAKEKLGWLEPLQAQVNALWKQSRWLLDVIAFARDRQTSTPNPFRMLLALSPKRSSENIHMQNGLLSVGGQAKGAVKSRGSWPGPGLGPRGLGAAPTELSRSDHQLTSNHLTPPPHPFIPSVFVADGGLRMAPSRSADTLNQSQVCRPRPRSPPTVFTSSSPIEKRPNQSSSESRGSGGRGSVHSVSSDDSTGNSAGNQVDASLQPVYDASSSPSRSRSEGEDNELYQQPPGILQVFAAYETGLAAGTSLKLHVSGRTTAREVVDLVVKQLNMAVVLKGKEGPIYPPDQLGSFCLVAVIGARERTLRDDTRPLELQNPWRRGRLYVRQRSHPLPPPCHPAFL